MSCVRVFDLPASETRIEELRKITEKPDFWGSEGSQEVTRELSRLQNKLDKVSEMSGELDEISAIAEILAEEADAELEEEFYARAEKLSKTIEDYQTFVLAQMLCRMYMRWTETRGYAAKVIDELPDQEAGIKSVTFSVSGDYAYGYLKGEQGVHRLVRISPFDSAKRRHTSFASVEVVPVLPESVQIEIRPEDLKMDTFRSSGAGGQYVNMTDSAVRITHIPTGIIVSCQTERSQHMNRATAMQVLRSKLFERMMRERQEQLDSIQGEKRSIAWGSQIRSYTLQPFQLVKDHRSGCEIGNVQAVLDGSIDELIIAYLRFLKSDKKQ